jgi:hypothetical protein
MALVIFDVIPVMQPVTNTVDLFYIEKSVYIHATISSPQDFTQNVVATVHAVGSIGSPIKYIWDVCVCFSQAYYVFEGQITPNINQVPYAGPSLNVTQTAPNEPLSETFGPNGSYLVGPDQTIVWQAPVDSVPYIIITYKNNTVVNGIGQNVFASQGYPAKSIHVESYASMESDKVSAKFYVTSIIAIPLSTIEIGLQIRKKRKDREVKDETADSDPTKTKYIG